MAPTMANASKRTKKTTRFSIESLKIKLKPEPLVHKVLVHKSNLPWRKECKSYKPKILQEVPYTPPCKTAELLRWVRLKKAPAHPCHHHFNAYPFARLFQTWLL